MNTIVIILVSVIIGASAGALSAIVVTNNKNKELSTTIHSIRENVENLVEIVQLQNETAQNSTMATVSVNEALQRFILKYKQDRAWVTQSLNDLWIDYDERHKATEKTVETAVENNVENPVENKPKKTTRKRKKKEVSPEVSTETSNEVSDA